MKTCSMLLSLLALLFLLPQPSHSTTILVDGVSEWKNPNVYVGDSIIFRHKYHYNLYIFQNQKAFNLCNFTQATLLTKPSTSSYSWHPSRVGFFYFAFNNGSFKSCNDTDAQMLSIKVSLAPSPPSSGFPPGAAAPIPEPDTGNGVPSSPVYPWPFQPREGTLPPAPAPSAASSPISTTVPTLVPDKSGGMPFINSNPAVPLPTGEVDSATIRPLPTSGDHHQQVEVGLHAVLLSLFWVVLLLLWE